MTPEHTKLIEGLIEKHLLLHAKGMVACLTELYNALQKEKGDDVECATTSVPLLSSPAPEVTKGACSSCKVPLIPMQFGFVRCENHHCPRYLITIDPAAEDEITHLHSTIEQQRREIERLQQTFGGAVEGRASLKQQLAAVNERNRQLLATIYNNGTDQQIQMLSDSLDAARSRLDENEQYRFDLLKERDAARKEVDRLKSIMEGLCHVKKGDSST